MVKDASNIILTSYKDKFNNYYIKYFVCAKSLKYVY